MLEADWLIVSTPALQEANCVRAEALLDSRLRGSFEKSCTSSKLSVQQAVGTPASSVTDLGRSIASTVEKEFCPQMFSLH